MKTLKEKYIVIYDTEEMAELRTIAFFNTKSELEGLIKELYEKRTSLNQRFAYFARVFPKGCLYPTSYDEFWERRKSKERKTYGTQGDFIVQLTQKRGRIVQKCYGFPEDFDWQLDKWKEKYKEILILDENESLSAEYYYQRDIEKRWGEKNESLFS